MRPEYAGCKSWLQLLDSVTIDSLQPAMTDGTFCVALLQADGTGPVLGASVPDGST